MQAKWFKQQIKLQRGVPRLGPSFFVSGDKKMMTMTRPIDAFLFGFDQMIALLNPHIRITNSDASFPHLFSSTLNSLIADTLNYFQNRIRLTIGKEISITSIPQGKSDIKKYFNGIDVKTVIGDKGYKELKKLDEVRGNFQHGNDRYFIDCRVNGQNIENVRELVKYAERIKRIIIDLDNKLEELHPTYHKEIIQEPGKTTITMQALGHSFDLEKMKVNKTDNGIGN